MWSWWWFALLGEVAGVNLQCSCGQLNLKDDHENVSFNSMLENPEYQNVNASLLMDDVQFYGHSTPVYQPVVEKTRIKGKFDGGLTYHTLGDRNAET